MSTFADLPYAVSAYTLPTPDERVKANDVIDRANNTIKQWQVGKAMAAIHVHKNVLAKAEQKYSILGDQEKELLLAYAAAVMRAQHGNMFFAEVPTPVVRLFLDMHLGPLREQSVEAAAIVVNRTVKSFYSGTDDAQFTAIVCAMQSARTATSGVRIFWPRLSVTHAMALEMRESIVTALADTFGKRPEPANDWADAVDASVYSKGDGMGGGVRMLASRMAEDCNVCKGLGKALGTSSAGGGDMLSLSQEWDLRCCTCRGNGRVDAGGAYMPLLVLGRGGRRDMALEGAYFNDFHALLCDTKIRSAYSSPPEQGYAAPGGGARAMDTATAPGAIVVLPRSHEAYDVIQAFLRTDPHLAPGGVYSELLVTDITTNARQNLYYVHVHGVNSRFCTNVGSAHPTNRIYFQLTSEGCMQRCHGTSGEAASATFGLCSQFCSEIVPLPPRLASLLFSATAAGPPSRPQQHSGGGASVEGLAKRRRL
jgi:hypothetical protein